MNKWLLILLVYTTAFCQERKTLSGKVINGSIGISNVFVINKVTGAEVKTNAMGEFSILAKPGDKIAIYNNTVEARDFAISEKSFTEVPYVVEVNVKGTELKEVVVDGSITSEKLGIVPKGQKQYTPAERRLYTAGDFKPVMLLGLLGGGMPLDPLINAINGRTKKLKKQVALEKSELLLKKLHNICTASEIINDLKIPEEHVDGFLYFVTEDKDVAAHIDAKNLSLAKFRITELAQQYSALIKNE